MSNVNTHIHKASLISKGWTKGIKIKFTSVMYNDNAYCKLDVQLVLWGGWVVV